MVGVVEVVWLDRGVGVGAIAGAVPHAASIKVMSK
jgi:hypothetical protein